MVEQVYRPRRPRQSPLWQCLSRHFERFLAGYEERFQPRYGFLRPIIPEVVNKFLDCGDLERGFARIRCDDCKQEYLLAFSCKGRWFCPSCHLPAPKRLRQAGQKKVQLFGALLTETILFPVPHRHFTFGIPKMLRTYFRFDRDLLKDLCHLAHECLLDYLRTTLDLPDGQPGIVMAIHTFGEYMDFHPHVHALVADGLSSRRVTLSPRSPSISRTRASNSSGITGGTPTRCEASARSGRSKRPKPPAKPCRSSMFPGTNRDESRRRNGAS